MTIQTDRANDRYSNTDTWRKQVAEWHFFCVEYHFTVGLCKKILVPRVGVRCSFCFSSTSDVTNFGKTSMPKRTHFQGQSKYETLARSSSGRGSTRFTSFRSSKSASLSPFFLCRFSCLLFVHHIRCPQWFAAIPVETLEWFVLLLPSRTEKIRTHRISGVRKLIVHCFQDWCDLPLA